MLLASVSRSQPGIFLTLSSCRAMLRQLFPDASTMPDSSAHNWDIFCTVIDNYGDIGVAWRLARRLTHDFGYAVRLWVDELASFSRIAPLLAPGMASQELDGIRVCQWRADDAFVDYQPAQVVIEAFGCRLPDAVEQAMARADIKPVWINLEYLSAEEWVEGCHGMASPHPRLPLTKYFFFPGFTDHTGGLLCEDGLIETRQQWQQDSLAQRAFWQMFDIPEKQPEEWRVSLFAYENPAARELLTYWTESPMPVHCMVPEGKILADVEAVLGQPLRAGQHVSRGALTVHVLPMTDQDSYDLTLWSCDINFVRGEDSFVRAQWAGRPFIWHIYPQEDAAHKVKLDAFLSHYCRGIDAETASALQAASHAWNHGQGMLPAWQALEKHLPQWHQHSRSWPDKLLHAGDLGMRLVQFIQNRLK